MDKKMQDAKAFKKRKASPLARRENVAGYAFFFPTILGIVLLTYGQIIYSFYISVTDWNIFSEPKFIGLQNYIEIFTKDFFFQKSLLATLFYAFGSVLFAQTVALLLALLLNTKFLKGKAFFRTLFYIPTVVPTVATCLLWMWMYNPDFGLLNAILTWLGLPKSQWIYSEATVIPSLILMSAWTCGSAIVTNLAGLTGVPTALLEACELDGGNAWTKFWSITVPMISPVIFYNTIMGIINGFMTFTQPYIMTSGGPNNSSLLINYYIYRTAFNENKFGYASALAWIIFIVLGVCTLILFKFFGKKVYYGSEN